MSLFKKLKHSLAAIAALAALGITIEHSHAAPLGMIARASANAHATTIGTLRRSSATINSINARKIIGAGINPDG